MKDEKPSWLDDPDAPASEEEKIASARLRDALGDPALKDDAADFARALALADAPRPLPEDEQKVLVERAVAKVRPRGQLVRAVFGVGTALALAAAAVLVVGQMQRDAPRAASVAVSPATPPSHATALVQTRSTQELFGEPFAKPLSRGAASARIDRIAVARAGDLRENRFAMWGVR